MPPLRTSSLRLLRPSRAIAPTPIRNLRPLSTWLPKHLSPVKITTTKPPSLSPPQFPTQTRWRSTQTSSGKSQADLMVEELQELYETAKDEFEIATDSTNGTTIYAASDRESARDALNQLSAVFALYTTEMPSYDESQQPQQPQPDDSGSQIVSTYFDPADIKPEVRAEVKRRVGQRLRELENAVEALEERAKDD
ncbi:hypothetical protein ANOM_009851 [Aspergillus nomiae NRRL 13137]|uniref:3-oxoacyl-(Acyl-carrier-protein) reductase n=1 Tax=Aspergillus nomiae NRRL (strain ATCC 15546 / NRRL 13137 / CBS 260.88 / M93) TaxID=1509407 RepID=A0A0L1IS04_ASPN3|nr:uncharacterized protein ANOM_009851 [Aspergillus nomiae NRRL 13137]KNG82366.1 hypothetical protein ANOM_009851 [Aspergillus nomiae NRRL 13137]